MCGCVSVRVCVCVCEYMCACVYMCALLNHQLIRHYQFIHIINWHIKQTIINDLQLHKHHHHHHHQQQQQQQNNGKSKIFFSILTCTWDNHIKNKSKIKLQMLKPSTMRHPVLTSDNTFMVRSCTNISLFPSKACETLFKNTPDFFRIFKKAT